MKTPQYLTASMLALALLTVSGCSAISSLSDILFGKTPPRTALRQLTISTDIAANGGNATMLDVVFVYDPAAVARLPQTGPVWFQQKQALQNALADAIEVVSLQVPAASPDFRVGLPERISKAVGVYVFANYVNAAGQPIANLTPWKQAIVRLQPDTITYIGQ